MKKLIWLLIAASVLASCLVDNSTIQELNQMTAGDLFRRAGVEIQSPPPRPICPVPAN